VHQTNTPHCRPEIPPAVVAAQAVHVYGVADRLAYPRADEYTRLRATLAEFIAIQEENAKAS